MHATTKLGEPGGASAADDSDYESIFDDADHDDGLLDEGGETHSTQWPPPRKRPAARRPAAVRPTADELIAASRRIRRECDDLVQRYEVAVGGAPSPRRVAPRPGFERSRQPARGERSRPRREAPVDPAPADDIRSVYGAARALLDESRFAPAEPTPSPDARMARRKALLLMMIEELL